MLLVSLMTASVSIVTGLSIWFLYRAAFEQQQARLVEVAESQAQLILAISRFDQRQGHSEQDTLGQLRDAHARFRGFGETGEFSLARIRGTDIDFLLRHRHFDLDTPQPVPLDAEAAAPMRRALRGESGTLVGLDYRGELVLAAHEPLPELGWGIVAKIDLAEVRAPFLRAGGYALLTAALLIWLGTIVFLRITNPLVARVEASETRYRRLVENLQDCLLVFDPDLQITFVNSVVTDTFGEDRASLEARGLSALVPPGDLEVLERHLRRALEPPYHFSHESEAGEELWMMWSGGAVLGDRGEVRELMLVGRDVSARKQADAARLRTNKLESVGTLAGGVAHDLNNILMGLYGSISLASMELAPEHPATEFLESAEASMSRAKALSTRLLTFAKGGDPVTSAARIDQLVKETVAFHLSGSNVKPAFEITEDLWPCDADASQLEQVFSNLTVNADQAMPEGGQLHVRLENAKLKEGAVAGLPAGAYVKATVSDEGQGLPAETIDRVFDPYFTTKRGGSGLGLAITHSIVDRHHGHISVASPPGQGARFTLFLPAARDESAITPAPESLEFIAPLPSARILVMDDEPTVRSVLVLMLRSRGMHVESVDEGQAAIDAYRTARAAGTPFQLVITDLTVPGGLGGVETVERLLALDPDAKVVASSGYAEDPVLAHYGDHGFVGVLAKPYGLAELDALLRHLLTEQAVPEVQASAS